MGVLFFQGVYHSFSTVGIKTIMHKNDIGVLDDTINVSRNCFSRMIGIYDCQIKE